MRHLRRLVSGAATHAVLIGMVLIVLIPLYWMVVTAF